MIIYRLKQYFTFPNNPIHTLYLVPGSELVIKLKLKKSFTK